MVCPLSRQWNFACSNVVQLATGSEDQSVKVWKLLYKAQGETESSDYDIELKHALAGHTLAVTSVKWAKVSYNDVDHEILISISDDRTARIYRDGHDLVGQLCDSQVSSPTDVYNLPGYHLTTTPASSL